MLGDVMNIILYGTIIVIIICIILIWFMSNYNQYQSYIIRINEAENFIDTTLRKRFDLLNKSITIIKTNTKVKENIMEKLNVDEILTLKWKGFTSSQIARSTHVDFDI